MFAIRHREIVDMFNGKRSMLNRYYTFEEGGEPIPPDAKVVSVDYSFQRQAVEILMEHESFGLIPDGCLIPHADASAELKSIEIEQSDREKVVRELLDSQNSLGNERLRRIVELEEELAEYKKTIPLPL